jgi:hypothetical protein
MNPRLDMTAYSLLQLWMIVSAAPERRILWNRLEVAAEDEIGRRQAPA